MILNRNQLGKLSASLLFFSAFVPTASADERDFMGTPDTGQRVVVGLNASKCGICHAKSTSTAAVKLPTDVLGSGNDGWILSDELVTWVHDDLHYQAFAVLLGKQSQEMAKRLGIVDAKGESLVHQDQRCLACHSSVPFEQMKLNGNLLIDETRRDARFTIGVSCEACHGPAGNRPDGKKGWEEVHVVDALWRTMEPKRKYEEFGYWDVHSTRVQTRICLSCHLGNVEQKKIITHEMYAAGHPTLPSFELSQFTRQMPRHWRRLDEKPADLRDKFLKQRSEQPGSSVTFDPTDFPITKASMIAALVTIEESMQYSADLMGSEPVSSQWPELANYSCFACHHELENPGWRKAQRFNSTPGRPSLQEWPFTLPQAVVMALGDDGADFKVKIKNVSAALDAKPFGDFKLLKQALTDMAATAKKRSQMLDSIVIHPKQAESFLNEIAKVASGKEFIDYDSARQIVWAYERAHAELEFRGRPANKQTGLAIADMATGWPSQPPFLVPFDQQLLLWLPNNREIGSKSEVVELFVRGQKLEHPLKVVKTTEALERIAKYRPDAIRDGFKGLQHPQPNVVEQKK